MGKTMNTSIIELTPKKLFAYALFFIGLLLLSYTVFQCILLANGTIKPLKITEEPIGSNHIDILYGITLQIGMYALLIVVSYILIKTGVSIAKL